MSQSSYDALQAQNQQLQAQNQQLQAQVAGLQREARFVEAGDLLFPEGGYQLSPAGKAELSSNIVPKLTGLQNAKVVGWPPHLKFDSYQFAQLSTGTRTICRSARHCIGRGSTTI